MIRTTKIIAIDGYSSTGKSSLAVALAEKLNFVHIDTGAMYRAVTLFAMQECTYTHSSEIENAKLIRKLSEITLEFKTENNSPSIFLNGKNVENKIRSIEVSREVSNIAKIKEVRAFLVEKQQEIGKNQNVIMDGRDIGSVVFPTADIKFFVTAEVKERAKRRFKDMQLQHPEITLAEIEKNLEERDFIDMNREHSPLKQTHDAIVIDNTHTTKAETLQKMYEIVVEKLF